MTDWARQLLVIVRRPWPDRRIGAVADRTSAARELLAACRAWSPPVTIMTRLRLDAVRSEPAPLRHLHQRGRPRLKGQRLPTLAAMAADPQTQWTPVVVADWYGRGERRVAVVSATAVW